MIERKAIFFDKDRCVGCYACVIACKLKHSASPHPRRPPEAEPRGFSPLNIHQQGPIIVGEKVIQYFQPLSCMHCQEAPCINVCPSSAIKRDLETDVVLVDQELCIGCKFCLWACPYGAPHFDETGKMVKCDMCVERLKEGKKAACEAVCIAKAVIVDNPEKISEIQAKKAIQKGEIADNI